jgi:hypothetical protein
MGADSQKYLRIYCAHIVEKGLLRVCERERERDSVSARVLVCVCACVCVCVCMWRWICGHMQAAAAST